MRKLLDKKGETLIETMAAILIFTMASIILYSMVTTASKINGKAKDVDLAVEQQLVAAEHAGVAAGSPVRTPGEENVITMTIISPETSKTEIPVEVYRSDKEDGTLYSYFKNTAPAAEEGGGGI